MIVPHSYGNGGLRVIHVEGPASGNQIQSLRNLDPVKSLLVRSVGVGK